VKRRKEHECIVQQVVLQNKEEEESKAKKLTDEIEAKRLAMKQKPRDWMMRQRQNG
jgi:hypothetical protein